jgi:hypothetical protein
MTCFGLLQACATIYVPVIGFIVGKSKFGLTVGVISGILGIAVGYVVGTAPLWLGWLIWDYFGIRKRKTGVLKSKLKNVLNGGYYFEIDQWIAELVIRGEPVESFWPDVLSLLRSEMRRNSYGERYYGWKNLKIWFPRIAILINGFDPNAPPAKRREYLAKIENTLPCAEPIPRELGLLCSDFDR